MNYVISAVLSIISGILVAIIKGLIEENNKLRKEKDTQEHEKSEALCNGVLQLLKIQIIEYHDKYMAGDNIPPYVYANFDSMYKAYKALGGNGTITRMKEDIDKLRVGK